MRLNLLSLFGLLLCACGLSACGTTLGDFFSQRSAANANKPTPALCKSENIKMTSREIYFDLNSTVLDEEALIKIQEAAEDAKASPTSKLNIIGYTDKSGNPAYNHRLSSERATAVAKSLKKHGVKGSNLKIDSCGAEAPAIPTLDDVKFRENRRVVIQIQKK